MEGECFLCCCLYSTVNNFIVLEHIELELELIIRILRDTECWTRANPVSKTQNRRETTELNKRVHHRIEQACSRIATVYVSRLCLPISN